MSHSALSLRYMRHSDLDEVVAIDEVSFDPPWSRSSYTYEISRASYSHMVVLEGISDGSDPHENGWRRWLPLWKPTADAPSLPAHVLGYGGLWNIADEGHISTIATHPQWRGHGYGEILLTAMIQRSITLGAAYIVLEVRVSNQRAQNLYQKYSFHTVGVKKNYYRSNNEDAYDMRLELTPDYVAAFKPRFQALQAKHQLTDTFSNGLQPTP